MELLNILLWVNGHVVFLHSIDISSDINLSLDWVGGCHNEKDRRVDSILGLLVLVYIGGDNVDSVPSTQLDFVLLLGDYQMSKME